MSNPTDGEMINAARRIHNKDGELEIDSPGSPMPTARVSRGDANGAYVLAWVWVYDKDVKPEDKK